MERRGEKPSDWPVVITIHGIRTTGDWQREFTDVLTQHGFRHVPLGFGFFKAVSLLIPWSRARKVEWFRRVYSDKFASADRLPSVVAHSFGSYIVTKAMLKYDDIRFDKVILCGSIVSRKYPWSTVLTQRNQASAVLNEAGGRDVWAGLVEWLVSDAGSSGVSGFEDTADGRLTQLIHERHEHSDYFYRQNFEKRWVPFLSGKAVQKVIPAGDDGVNWKFAFTATVVLALAITAAAFGLSDVLRSKAAEVFAFSAATTEEAESRLSKAALSQSADKASVRSPAVGEPIGRDAAEPAEANTLPSTEATADVASFSTAEPVENDNTKSSQQPMVDDAGNELRRMFEFLRGEWMQNGYLPEKSTIVSGGRCKIRQHAVTRIIFESMDPEKNRVVGRWSKTSQTEFQFVRSETAMPVDVIRAGRESCQQGRTGDRFVSMSDEEGEFSAGAVLWNMWGKALASVDVTNCVADGIDCETSRYGKTTLPSIEKISKERFRIDEMMFVRQPPVP